MSKYTIITLDEVYSTNGYALDNVLYFDDGTVISARRQTNGRGRYNRKWLCDDSENIYMSLVLKPTNVKTYPFANLTQYLSVILCEFLEQEFGLSPKIKWPNDILICGAKISGILAETSYKNNNIEAIVLGLGLNVNMPVETIEKIDQKATSLSVLLNKSFDTQILLTKLLDKFYEKYINFIEHGFFAIKEDYIKRCEFLGKNITVSENNIKKVYFAKSVDDDGFLTVTDENNNDCRLVTGDVLC